MTEKNEKEILHQKLLDAIKACQVYLSGKNELVTESSSWVSCLCSQLENAFQHRLKQQSSSAFSTFKQVYSGLQPPLANFWEFAKNHLPNDEIERVNKLKNISTDLGRGRAWLRCALNERSLQKHLTHMINDAILLRTYYEKDSFMSDEEIANTLPQMAAGLETILFNIKYDDASLDALTVGKQQNLFSTSARLNSSSTHVKKYEPKADITVQINAEKVRRRSGKKKRATIINFSEDESESSHLTPSISTSSHPSLLQDSQRRSPVLKDQFSAHSSSVHQILNIKSPSISSHDLVMEDWGSSHPALETSKGSGLEFHPASSEDYRSPSAATIESDPDEVLAPASDERSDLTRSSFEDKTKFRVMEASSTSHMDANDLHKALIAVMQRKEELVEKNNSSRSLLEQEMERSASLRVEVDCLKKELKETKDSYVILGKESEKEAEVLRNQLKKYVGAVQALQRDSPRSVPKNHVLDVCEAEVYEKKLIDVTEMHAELMEFNERLMNKFKSSLNLMRNMKAELVDLRGPMPSDNMVDVLEDDNLNCEDKKPSRALINIWMPSIYLIGKGPDAHHIYQVYVRINEQEWNIYRRYSHFHELHIRLRKKFPLVDTFNFPPKKVVGNKDRRFVEDRRKMLQMYLRLLMNNLIQNHEKMVLKPNKETLISLLPFFSETSGLNKEVPQITNKSSNQR